MASVVGGPLEPNAPFAWKVSGAGAFKDYVATDQNGTVLPLANGALTQPTVAFFTAQTGKVNMSCTVRLQIPPDARVEGGLPTLTLEYNGLPSSKPTATWDVIDGQVGFDNLSSPTYIGFFGIAASPTTGNLSKGVGQEWTNISITMPSGFSDVGETCFVQLITPNRKMTRANSGNAPAVFVQKNATTEALDSGFPYRFIPPAYPYAGDAPENPLNYDPRNWNQNDTGGRDWVSVSAHDTFRTWLMFRPKASGGQKRAWIPLKMYTWKWNADATRTSGVWSLTPGASGSNGDPKPTNDFPTWNLVMPSPFQFVPKTQ